MAKQPPVYNKPGGKRVGPYNRGGKGKPVGPYSGGHPAWHDEKIRAILSDAGYRVARTGGYTARAHAAWDHYLAAKRGGSNIQSAAHAWNSTPQGQRYKGGQPVGGGPGSRRGGAYVGPGGDNSPGFKKFVKQHPGWRPGHAPKGDIRAAVTPAHRKAAVHANAAKHAKHLGAKGHKHGGAGVPGVVRPGIAMNFGVTDKDADKIAGLQFDPAIREARLQQLRDQRDEAQAQQDIAHWGNIVSGSLGTARTRDAAASEVARADVTGAIQGIQKLLGGSRAGDLVGAAGANDLTALTQAGAAQSAYNADLAPILRAGQSDQSVRERALASQAAEKLQAQLLDLQGQRGQAKAKALIDLRQQGFTNRLALQNAQLAAQSLGLKADQVRQQFAQAGFENQLRSAAFNAQQRQAAQQAKLAREKAHPPHGWKALDPAQRDAVIKNAVDSAITELPKGVWDETHILNSALSTLRSGSYRSARKLGYKGGVPNRQSQAEILGYVHRVIAQRRGQRGQ